MTQAQRILAMWFAWSRVEFAWRTSRSSEFLYYAGGHLLTFADGSRLFDNGRDVEEAK